MTESPPGESHRRWVSPRLRRAVLTAHIIVSVGLLGDAAAFLAVSVRAAGSDDTAFAATAYELLDMFSLVFGIPLSFAALITGLALAISGKWGVLRYPWVATKLLLIVSVILVGVFVIGSTPDELRSGVGGSEARLIGGATWDVLALCLAVGLGVYKPGRPFSWARRRHPSMARQPAERRS